MCTTQNVYRIEKNQFQGEQCFFGLLVSTMRVFHHLLFTSPLRVILVGSTLNVVQHLVSTSLLKTGTTSLALVSTLKVF